MKLREIRIFMGNRIREERAKKNLSIEQLAELVDVSPSFLGLVERGDRALGLEKLLRMAAYFEITVDYLINEKHDSDIFRLEDLKALIDNLDDKDYQFVINSVRYLKQQLDEVHRHKQR